MKLKYINTFTIIIGTLLTSNLVQAENWCNNGKIYTTKPITLSGKQLLSANPPAPSTITRNVDKARWLAGQYCNTEFTVATISDNNSSGLAKLISHSISAPKSYLTAYAYINATTSNYYYTIAEGITFKCERCDVPFAIKQHKKTVIASETKQSFWHNANPNRLPRRSSSQ